MIEKLIAEHDTIITEDGRKMKLSLLRAREIRLLKDARRNFLKKLPADKKKDFYFHAYELLDKQTIADKKEPIMRIGLSPYTFMSEPVIVDGFQTNFGELFTRIHQALDEASSEFEIDE
jgi:hypothetical protein